MANKSIRRLPLFPSIMPGRRPLRTSNSSFDPLDIYLQPPANETKEQKAARLEAAWEATRVSQTIDAELAESRKALERKKCAVKILLLDFRLALTPKYFENERLVWKTVIQLNLINSIKKILTVLQEEWEELETDSAESKHETALTSEHRRLALSLSPLLAFETSTSRIMESSTGDYTVTVRPGGGWKDKLASFGNRSPSTTPEAQSPTGETDSDPSQVTQVLAAFLNDTARIAALDYIPSDRDIMRARIKTPGVEEHRFVTESGFRAGTEFYITDVCGSSNQVPYFDDVQAIVFLAPLAFWQSLDEDSKVNRVQDSLELWREIVGNPLLAKTAFILLFNKKDVLQAHIAAGVPVKKYVPGFGDRPNDVVSLLFSVADFRDKFSAYHRKFSPEPRPFIFYEIEAIDTKVVAAILSEVQEQIIRNHLKDLNVIKRYAHLD
ncbi:G-protein alpha subunit [Mycena olivaceomarginata]|nr:G-protein alpha subunit [Mycena olivaceomarginata]